MEKEDINKLLEECQSILDSCKSYDKELKEIDDNIQFLQNEYKTNKYYFAEDGEPTVYDVIKTVFEFAWSAHKNYNYDKE